MACSPDPAPGYRIRVATQRSPASLIHNRLMRLVVLANEAADDGINVGLPARPGKKIVMIALVHREAALVAHGNTCAQVLRGVGLAGSGNVVQLAFDCEQGSSADVLRTHWQAAHAPVSTRPPYQALRYIPRKTVGAPRRA